MKILSILIGKSAAFACKLIGRGSSFPGQIAQKIDKNILKKFKLPNKIIVVTGSSGKGSTTSIIAHTYRKLGYTVAHNKEGGNQTTGIITTLIKNSTITGKTTTDVVVLEMDERYIKYICPLINPTDIIITNITRDQPPRQRHTNFIIEEIKKGLPKNAHLYLNANDPILQNFVTNPKQKVTYYGVEKLETSYQENLFNSLNCPRCPKCHKNLNYEFYHIEDIGNYHCSNKKCNFKMPNPKYTITSFKDNNITINNKLNITLTNNMLYNYYNTIAAFSVLKEAKLNEKKIAQSISNLNKNKKIYNKYKLNNREIYVLNNKCENASTYNQSMLYTKNDNRKKTIIIGWHEISRRYLWDDLSWLYDIEFELLKMQDIDTIIVAGPQRYDIAIRLKYAGINQNKIKINKDLYDAKENIKNSQGNIYAILNFDYLNDFNTVMEELK